MTPCFRSVPAVFVSLLLAACGGKTLYSSSSEVSPLPPPAAYQCAQAQLKAMKYTLYSHDDDSYRLVANQRDTVTSVVSTQLRKVQSRLEIDAKPSPEGGSYLKVLARTIKEEQNAGGIRTEEMEASEQVKADAAALTEACKNPVSQNAVPPA